MLPHDSMLDNALSAIAMFGFIVAIAALGYHREIVYNVRRSWRKYKSAPLLTPRGREGDL